MADGIIRNTPQNPVLGAVSNGLRSARDAANVVPLPQFLGGGLGNAVFGHAPEELENWSYGNSPMKERFAGVSPRYPDFKTGRAQNVADVVFLPAAEAVGAAKLAGRGMRGAFEAATEGTADMGRREALRKIGGTAAAGAATALGGVGLRDLERMLPKMAEREAPRVAAAVARAAPHEFYSAYRNLRGLARQARKDAFNQYSDEIAALHDAGRESFLATPEGRAWQKAVERYVGSNDPEDFVPDWLDDAGPQHVGPYEDVVYKARGASFDAWDNAYDKGLRELRADPRYAGYKTPTELEELAKADARAGKHDLPSYWAEARRLGMLPDEEVEAAVRQGKPYTDPTTGNSAFLDKYGNLSWRSPSGDTSRYQHWLHEGSSDMPF